MDFANKFESIQKKLNLSQKDLSIKLGLSTNAISQYITGKRKPDYTTIQKLINLGVSPYFLFSDGKEPFDPNFQLFAEAVKYINSENEKELIEPISEFVNKHKLINLIKSKIEKLKGQSFFEKVIEEFSNKGEKTLKFLYYFILYIERTQKNFDFLNIKKSFIDELEKFELSKKDRIISFELKENDRKRLIEWIENELDDSSIFEIISNIEQLKKIIKEELNIFNKYLIQL
ncbi:MAG: helix-turn-helix domain-containing protein [Aliarcobacter sp.]|nr:helix-turn-helix domain-containing protein [Aliarcobacter sp.]MDD2887757.1 helix-turn-helix domain-containing protein [Aliarcobacter sp.]